MREDCNRVERYFHALDIMPVMKKEPIFFLFNSPLASGCDYVVQTMRIVSATHPAYGVSLGDIIFFPRLLFSNDRWVVRTVGTSVVVRPVSLLPGVRFRLIRMLTYMITVLGMRVYIALRYRDTRKILWFFEPFHIPALLWVLSGYIKIYDCVDYYPAFNTRAKSEHTRLLQTASYVFANSYPLAKAIRTVRNDVIHVPVGFADTLFGHSRVLPIPPGKKLFTVGHIGSISSRINFRLVTDMVKKMPDVRFLFVGPIEPDVFGSADSASDAFHVLLRYPNVRWISSVSKHSIPSTLAKMDVGIVPYRINHDFNRYSFPMKVMEYFAAGKPVVSTDIVSLRQFDKAGILTITSEFTQAIAHIRNTGWGKKKQKQQWETATRHSWKNKISAIMRSV